MEYIKREFLKILSSAISKKSQDDITVKLDELQNLAIVNKCSSLLCQGAVNSSLYVPKSWKDALMITVINNYKNLEIQKKVLDILGKNNVLCVVMKGITAAVNYPDPMSRALGDIDILIKPSDYDAVLSLFGKASNDNQHKFHYSFMYDGVSVEIHKYIDDYESCINGQKISDIMLNALDEIQYVNFENYKVPCLKKEYQAIVYLSHMLRHFDENELSMRMFCDWISFVKNIDEHNWWTVVYPFIKKAGLDGFSDAVCTASGSYMNIDISNKIKNPISADVVDALMREFLYEDKSSTEEHLTGNVTSLYSKMSGKKDGFMVSTIKALNELANRNFPKLSKFKITLPFCWIYLIIRYLIRVVIGKRRMLKYSELVEGTNQKKFIKKELNL